jgi:hypothetical protein
VNVSCVTLGERKMGKLFSETMKSRNVFAETGLDGNSLLSFILRKWGWRVCTGYVMFRMGTSDRFL